MAGDPEDACSEEICQAFADSSKTPLVWTEPGVVAAAAKGFNTRFDMFQGEFKYDGTYKPDKIVGNTAISQAAHNATRSDFNVVIIRTLGDEAADGGASNFYKNNYEPIVSSLITDTDPTHTFQENRRVITFPFVKCTGEPGKHQVEVVGFGCFFLTQHMEQQGNNAYIYGEFIGDGCSAAGEITSVFDFGFQKVILYQDRRPGSIS